MSEESEDGEPGRDEPTERVSFTEAERRHRLDKLDALRERGINPYPVRFDREGRAGPLHAELGHLKPGEESDRHVALAGRIVGMRRHGGLDFADLRDETGQIQVMADRNHLGEALLEDFTNLDLGDWVGVSGPIVCSDLGELSVRAESFELLSKAIRALPDFRKGLADAGDRYRRRYLDLIVDEPSRRIFAIRSKVISTTRKVLLDRGFTEVETPVLLSQAGGAEARPFITHHNALDIDMYLRIALELPLKRLIVGGMNRVFEIGRVFRNEGLDTRHNPEFTLLEAYQAFGDYHDMMDLVEEIVSTSAIEAIGTTVVQIDGKDVDLKPPWRRATMAELIEENAGVKMHPSMPIDEAREIADRFGVEWLEVWGAGKIMAEVYDETCEAKLIEPTFVMDHPRETSPLARPHRDDPTLTERFEMVVAARELANAYSELNDPVDQAERFQDEARLQAGGDEEVEPVDDDYVEALEYGLPPTGGLGIGMDRLVMLISGAEAIRDVILFPTLRPEAAGADGEEGDDSLKGLTPIDDAGPEAPPLAPAPVQHPAAEADRIRHRSRAPRILAWLTAILGFASLLPTLPWIHVSLGIGDLLDRSGRADLFVVSALIGLGLITIANQLARRKHRAWVLAMLLLTAAAIVHIVKGPDPIAALLDIALLVALASYRTEFHAHGDPNTARQAIAFVPLFIGVVVLFGFLSLLTQRHYVDPGLSIGGMLDATFSGLLGGDGPYSYGHRLFADFFSDALLALGIAGLATFLFLVFRSVVTRGTPPRAERERAREIVHAYGTDTLAYFALRRDKSYFFSSDGRSLIAYAYVRGYAMVAADPIGPPEDTGRTIDEFLAFCDGQGWAVAFLAVREDDLPIYTERGMHSLYLGDEAILKVQDFTLDGSEMKAVRSAVRRVGKDHTFELIREPEASPELVAELNEISAEWRDGAEERGFTMELGQDVEGTDSDFVIAIARETGTGSNAGRVAGFLRFVPCFGSSPGYSLDLMRRRPDSTNGLTEYLIANAALGLKASGVERLSLNFAAWGRLLDDAEGAGLWGRVERRMARALNPFFQIQSLRDFNQKFDPEWYPRSIVIDDPGDLPKVTVLYASVEGFLEVPVIGKFLEPPVRAAERGEAAAAGAPAD